MFVSWEKDIKQRIFLCVFIWLMEDRCFTTSGWDSEKSLSGFCCTVSANLFQTFLLNLLSVSQSSVLKPSDIMWLSLTFDLLLEKSREQRGPFPLIVIPMMYFCPATVPKCIFCHPWSVLALQLGPGLQQLSPSCSPSNMQLVFQIYPLWTSFSRSWYVNLLFMSHNKSSRVFLAQILVLASPKCLYRSNILYLWIVKWTNGKPDSSMMLQQFCATFLIFSPVMLMMMMMIQHAIRADRVVLGLLDLLWLLNHCYCGLCKLRRSK